MRAEEVRNRGRPIGILVGRVASKKIGEIDGAGGSVAFETLALGFPAQLAEFFFEVLQAFTVAIRFGWTGAERGERFNVGVGIFSRELAERIR